MVPNIKSSMFVLIITFLLPSLMSCIIQEKPHKVKMATGSDLPALPQWTA